MTGWIKIWRQLLDWEYVDNPQMVTVWLQLILRANIEPTTWHGISVGVGQLVASADDIAHWTGVNEKGVRRCIKRLEDGQQIVTERAERRTLFTICNFKRFQEFGEMSWEDNGQQDGSVVGNDVGSKKGEKRATNNNKKGRREEEKNKDNPPTPLQGVSPQKNATEKEKCHAVTRYDRIWEDQFKMLTGDDFQWAKRENIAVNAIVGKIVQMMQAAGRDPTEADKENSFVWFITNIYTIGDTWVRSNFTPHVIADKFNEYYQTIKNNATNGKRNNTAGNPTGVSADYLARVAQQLAGDV